MLHLLLRIASVRTLSYGSTHWLAPVVVFSTVAMCLGSATYTLQVLPGSSGAMAFDPAEGDSYVESFTDDDFDGQVTIMGPAVGIGYGSIKDEQGGQLQWCDGTSISPDPGEGFEQPGFVASGGPTLLVLADVMALLEGEIPLNAGQPVQVVDGQVLFPPIGYLMLKDASLVNDVEQLLDPDFVASLPYYTGIAFYAPAGTVAYDEIPPECAGDANGDGAVDPLDSGYVLARLGCAVGTGNAECDAADVNIDGLVDPLDAGYVLARLGTCSPPPNSSCSAHCADGSTCDITCPPGGAHCVCLNDNQGPAHCECS